MQSGGKIEIEEIINESADYIVSSKLLKIHIPFWGSLGRNMRRIYHIKQDKCECLLKILCSKFRR